MYANIAKRFLQNPQGKLPLHNKRIKKEAGKLPLK